MIDTFKDYLFIANIETEFNAVVGGSVIRRFEEASDLA